jgi:hypothetical protein
MWSFWPSAVGYFLGRSDGLTGMREALKLKRPRSQLVSFGQEQHCRSPRLGCVQVLVRRHRERGRPRALRLELLPAVAERECFYVSLAVKELSSKRLS